MISIRKAGERGRTKLPWLDSRHTFSFSDYYDPQHMGFRALRVINDDVVAPGRGFATHSHQDMEIVTYVLEGALEHKDSLGNGSIIRPGEIQRMSAGTGITHSEYNNSKSNPVHFLQIWIIPGRRGLPPSYEQKPVKLERGSLRVLGAPESSDGAVAIHQDVNLLAGKLEPGDSIEHRLPINRHAWLHLATGALELNGHKMRPGDGAAITRESELQLEASEPSEVLVFDLA